MQLTSAERIPKPTAPGTHPLQPLLAPRSVALVGASDRPGSVGHAVLANLLAAGYRGAVHRVNPSHDLLGGERCYPRLDSLPEAVDLAKESPSMREQRRVAVWCCTWHVLGGALPHRTQAES